MNPDDVATMPPTGAAAMPTEPQIAAGQTYRAKDKRRPSILTIDDVPLMGNFVKGTSYDPVTRRTRRVIVQTARLLKKYNRIS